MAFHPPRSIPQQATSDVGPLSDSYPHQSTRPDASTIHTSIPFGEPTAEPTYDPYSPTDTATSLHGTTSSWSTSTRPTSYSLGNASTTTHRPGWSAASSPTATLHSEHHAHHSDMSTSELVAAILVPILAVLALCLLAFCFLRRRTRTSRDRAGSGGSSFLPALKEKWGSLRSSLSSASEVQGVREPDRRPVVTGTENNAYYTGLDTSSHGGSSRGERGGSGEFASGRRSEGGTTFVVPPPPYHVQPAGTAASAAPALPQLGDLSGLNFDLSQFSSVAPTASQHPPVREQRAPVHPPPALRSPLGDDISAADLLAMPLDPPRPSSRSARSITSTLYSDTASVHSAQAARRSVGPQVIAPNSNSSRGRSGSLGDPFGDPNTPITPLSAQDAPRGQLQ